ncbi:hypothetical protein BDZ97DRAFT_2060778 [Flammula alnicola]|nr:hypothetical protein BDZ97DRAFT_2060778 [Flammula alnicola]
MSVPPSPTIDPETKRGMFGSVENLTINNGVFNEVGQDYHVHGDSHTHIYNTSQAQETSDADGGFAEVPLRRRPRKPLGFTNVARDYHVHGDYHVHYHDSVPSIIRISRVDYGPKDGIPPHYHVYQGRKFEFCTWWSPEYRDRGFPIDPSVPNLAKYARVVLERDDVVIKGSFRRPYTTPIQRSQYGFGINVPSPPKFGATTYIPQPEFDTSDTAKENMLPCMQAARATRASPISAFSPRAALFSHLDHSGVK